jgi:hypothetical protein
VSVLAFAAVLLALVAGAEAARQLTSARVVITKTDQGYRATWTNDGDQPILCAGLLLDGVQPTGATGPAGVLTRVGTFQGRGLVHMQGTAAVPAIPPGGTVAVDFTTNVPIAANAGGEIRYSPTCVTGSDVVGRATGPAAAPPPPPAPAPPPPPAPKPKACVCKDLKTRIVANRSNVTGNATGFTMELLVEWRLTCTKGPGGCKGSIQLVPSVSGKRRGIAVTQPAAAVTCNGPCAKTTTRFQKVVVTGGARWANGKRGRSDRLVRLQVKRTCKGTRVPQTLDVVFDRQGGFDLRRSDLDGNGIEDRRD